MKKTMIVLAVSLFVLNACSMRNVRDYNRNAPNQSEKQIEKAFVYACKARGWVCKPNQNNNLDGFLQKSKTYVEIEMIAKPEGFTFKYVDSENMKYKKGKIHKGYYRWLNYLQNSVYKGLSDPSLLAAE